MALVVAAAVFAGLINAVAGSGTLVTFPALLAVGFAPVSATMTNAVGLAAGGFSGVWGYRRELTGQGRRLAVMLPASVLGAVGGAWLLLHLPEDSFEVVVPVLVVLALVLVLLQPRLQRRLRARSAALAPARDDAPGRSPVWPSRRAAVLTVLGTLAVGVYGGYFTAAQGIMLVGVMGALMVEQLQRLQALKNVLALAVNLVAATTYALVGGDRVVWGVAGLIAVASLVGGYVGARVGRRLPDRLLRAVIVAVGVAAVAVLVVRR